MYAAYRTRSVQAQHMLGLNPPHRGRARDGRSDGSLPQPAVQRLMHSISNAYTKGETRLTKGLTMTAAGPNSSLACHYCRRHHRCC